jgi:hypothetical protein
MPQVLLIRSLPQLRLFTEHHVFAVWDFMQLLKSLQELLAPAGVPWLPPRYPRLAGLINELVAAEECDCLPVELGGPCYLSHFSLYRAAMQEIGADTSSIDAVLAVAAHEGLDRALLHPAIPEPSRRFMQSTRSLIQSGQPHLQAAAFCFGRELLVPDLFRALLDQLQLHSLHAPILSWYFKRHISLDGDSHGPLAEQMVAELCESRPGALSAVESVRNRVVRERDAFWESIARVLAYAPHVQPLSTPSSQLVPAKTGVVAPHPDAFAT